MEVDKELLNDINNALIDASENCIDLAFIAFINNKIKSESTYTKDNEIIWSLVEKIKTLLDK